MSSSLSKLSNLFRSTTTKKPPKPTSKLAPKPRKPSSESPPKISQPSSPKPPKKFRMLSEKLKIASTADKYRVHRANNYVRRLAAANQFSLIEEAVQHQKQARDATDEAFDIKLIALYGRGCMFDNALQLFDEIPQKSCKSFNALLAASVYAKKFDITEQLFRDLPDKYDIKPDIVSYNILARSYCQSGSLDLALKVIEKMESNGVEPDLVTYNTLLTGVYQNKRLAEAEKLWSLMESKNFGPSVRSYDPKFRYLIENDQISEAIIEFNEMRNKGIKPDRLSYYLFIKGFSDKGDLEETKRWYDQLKQNMVRPDRRIIKMILPFVTEKGDLDYAIELANEAAKWKCIVNVKVLQDVVDKLVKESRIDEAKELVSFVGSLHYYNKKLKLPVE